MWSSSRSKSSGSTKLWAGNPTKVRINLVLPGKTFTFYYQFPGNFLQHPTDWLDWLIRPLIDWLIDWSVHWLIDWLIDWLVHWLIDWLIDWLVDRLIDWLIEWLIVLCPISVYFCIQTWTIFSFLFFLLLIFGLLCLFCFSAGMGYAKHMLDQLNEIKKDKLKKRLHVGMQTNKIMMKHYRRQYGFWNGRKS